MVVLLLQDYIQGFLAYVYDSAIRRMWRWSFVVAYAVFLVKLPWRVGLSFALPRIYLSLRFPEFSAVVTPTRLQNRDKFQMHHDIEIHTGREANDLLTKLKVFTRRLHCYFQILLPPEKHSLTHNLILISLFYYNT